MNTPTVFTAFILSMILVAGCSDRSSSSDAPIRVISYNIKYDNPADTVNGWAQRRERIINLLRFYQPDFIGTQEGLLHQLRQMQAGLDSMQWIGVGRTDGNEEGEYSALFYNARRFSLVEGSDSTAWLSETPGRPSKSWDAALPRILTWGQFRDHQSGKTFFVFNTHFDHIGDTARARSAALITRIIREVAADAPVVLTGDFNATEASLPYKTLTDDTSPLRDAYYHSELPHVGPEFSFEGFDALSDNDRRRIDYIFVSDAFRVLKHAIISDFRGGRYPSDHLPVVADLELTQ